MTAGAALRAAPATLPGGLAVVALLVLAADGGGIRVGQWTPLAFGLLALLALTAVVLHDGLRDVPSAALAALGGLAALCAWSYLSILWASDQGAAWEGANRLLLLLLVAALFGLWRQRAVTATWLLGGWAAGMVALAAVVAVRILGADAAADWFFGDRLVEPLGYANAQAALWMLPIWPCVALAASPRVPLAVRAWLAGGAVLLLDLALLCLSRGAVAAFPVAAALFLACAPGRLRHLAVLAAIGAGAAVSVPFTLDVGPALRVGAGELGAVHAAMRAALAGAVLVVALVVGGVLLARRADAPTAARVRRAWAITATAGVALATLAAVVLVATRAGDAWRSFDQGYETRGAAQSRLGQLGSNRSDFYRAALKAFGEEPVLGVGADNYQAAYLRLGRSRETPRFAHSWPLETLADLGVVGGLIAVAWLAAIGWVGVRILRAGDPLGVAAGAGALFGFAGFLVHGAGDWLWQFPAASLPAFALLGMAAALVPPRAAPRSRAAALAGAAAITAGCVVAAASFALPWAAERASGRAGTTWPRDPLGAFQDVDRAARLNPLSAGPYLTGGTIAVRRRTLGVADRYFAAALARNPDLAYALLQRGAIASARGDRARAIALLSRAVALDPRNEVAADALARVRRGETLDVTQVNVELLARSRSVGT